jgi:hypothetical protein
MSQKSEMRAALIRGESFTRMEVLHRWGCSKAPARISELRQEGLPDIVTKMITSNGKRFARWYLPKLMLPGMEE